MKKELCAACILLCLILLAAVNILWLSRITKQMESSVSRCVTYSEQGQNDLARERLQSAFRLWQKNSTYLYAVLRHSEIDTVDELLFALKGALASEDPREVCIRAEELLECLKGLREVEIPSLGSIF